MTQFIVRKFENKDKSSVFSLYENTFKEENFMRFKRRWDWQFLNCPGIDREPPIMLVAERQDGKIVGFFASYSVGMKIGATETVLQEHGDLMVSNESRQQGIGQSLMKAHFDIIDIINIGSGYVPATGRILRRLDHNPVFCEPIYIRLLDLKLAYKFFVDKRGAKSLFLKKPLFTLIYYFCAGLNIPLRMFNKIKKPSLSKKILIEKVEKVDSEFDELWKEVSPYFTIIVFRDSRFLKWRFLDDPNFQYTILVARDSKGKLLGYLAYRISKRRGILIARIMDIFCNPTFVDVIDSLLAKALNSIEKQQVAAISCKGIHPDIRKRISRFFIRAKHMELPMLAHCKGNKEIEKLVSNADNWHVAHADGDEGFAP